MIVICKLLNDNEEGNYKWQKRNLNETNRI